MGVFQVSYVTHGPITLISYSDRTVFSFFFLSFFPFLSAKFLRDGWIDVPKIFRDGREWKYLEDFFFHYFKILFPVIHFLFRDQKNLSQWNLRNGKDLNIKTLWDDRRRRYAKLIFYSIAPPKRHTHTADTDFKVI